MATCRRRGGSETRRRLQFELLEERRVLSVDIALISRAFASDTSADGDSYVYRSAISADGRYVAFISNATNLVEGVEIGANEDIYNVYRFDRITGDVVLVSVNKIGTGGGNASSEQPTISSDGNVVAFRSGATNLTDGHGNARYDIFVRDVAGGETHLASSNVDGFLDGDCFNPIISADGNVVSFISTSTSFHPLKTNANRDVFAWNRKTQTTYLVSANAAGTASGNKDSYNSGLSADGRIVVFISESSNLHPIDTNPVTDVFARDLSTGTTHLISVNRSGTSSSNGWSEVASVSADGNRIAFISSATNIDPLDTLNWSDVYVRDLSTNATQLATLNMFGTAGSNASVSHAVISADGKVVAFQSAATNLHPLDTELTEVGNDWDVFARNLEKGITYLVSVNSAGTAGGNDDGSSNPAISADGSIVAFLSGSSNLDPFDVDYVLDVYARNLMTGTTQLLSKNRVDPASGFHEIQTPIISSNGSHVAFFSNGTGLVANDWNNQTDAFVTTLSWNIPELPGDYNRDDAVNSADYSLWRDTLGATGLTPYSGPDGDGDGMVDQDDYLVWKANFGKVFESGSGAAGAGFGPQATDVSGTAGRASSGTRSPVDAVGAMDGGNELWVQRWRGLSALGLNGDGGRAPVRPPAEPGAGGIVQVSTRERDLGLLAWRSSSVPRLRGSSESGLLEIGLDLTSPTSHGVDTVFEDLGLGGLSLSTR